MSPVSEKVEGFKNLYKGRLDKLLLVAMALILLIMGGLFYLYSRRG